MLGAFAYLVGCTIRNRLFQRLRRLRHPRYVIGLAVGVAYLWFLLRPYPGRAFGPPPPPGGAGMGGAPQLLASLALAGLAARWWLFGSGTAALAFAPAEAQFLFPAPLRRRDLLTFKLVAAQVPLITSTVVLGLFTARWGRVHTIPLRMVALWMLLLTLFLHQLAASLVRAGLRHARPGAKRPLLAASIFVIGAAVLGGSLLLAVPAAVRAPTMIEAARVFGAAVRTPLATAVLWPFRAAVAPAFAATLPAWLRASAIALALLVAHYVWLLRLDVPFEDAAADASIALAGRMRLARRRLAGAPVSATGSGAAPSRRGAAWFPLRPLGPPAVAILWKNIVALQRQGWRGALPLTIVLVGIVAAVLTGQRHTAVLAEALAFGAAAFAVTLAVVGSAAFRIDLRRDVAYMGLLRTYPLSGVRIVTAEVASSVLPLTVAQVALIAFACAALPDVGLGVPIALRLIVFGIASVVFPLVNATTAMIGNATALLFPALPGPAARGAGTSVEMMGQVVVARIAALLGLMAALLIPGGIGVAAFWAASHAGSVRPAVLAGVLASAGALVAQLYLALQWLGRVFDRTDAVAVSAVD